jgi:hypothetical protein
VTAAYDFDLDDLPVDLLRADPVYLRADPGHLILFDAEVVGIDDNEADALLDVLNRSFKSQGLAFTRGRSASRWYVCVPGIAATATRSPRALRGQAIEPYLDDMRRAGALSRLMTEAQMVLYEAPVNTERESTGKPPLNSIWFWGLGTPPSCVSPPIAAVVGDDDLVAACARYCGVSHHRAIDANSAAAFGTDGSVAIVFDLDTNARGLEHVERNLLAPAHAALHRGRFDTLRITTRDTAFTMTRRTHWRFWRRLGGLKSVLEDAAEAMHATGITP